METTFVNLLDQVEVHEGSPVMAKKKRRPRLLWQAWRPRGVSSWSTRASSTHPDDVLAQHALGARSAAVLQRAVQEQSGPCSQQS
jgi:hypothetical protein